jgi:hypothetical protein
MENNDEATSPPIPKEEDAKPSPKDSGVMVSEDFQKKAHALISKASKHEVKHIHDRANMREDEIRQDEMGKKPGAKTPETYDSSAMPD